MKKTRLITIVSKPIKVVVLVVVVLLKKESVKNILVHKNQCPKNFWPKRVGSKKNLGKEKLGPKDY